jgi:hypothetical protein
MKVCEGYVMKLALSHTSSMPALVPYKLFLSSFFMAS